jgi:GST-like protein
MGALYNNRTTTMSNPLDAFPAARKWPARHPERLQLYSMPTPNGVKAAIMLEEIGLPYEVHRVAFERDEQRSPEFLSLNPNNKIPAIIDPDGPDGQPLPLVGIGRDPALPGREDRQAAARTAAQRYQTIQWLMFQAGGLGPMFGQLGFFLRGAGKDWDDKRPRDRFVAEARRLLACWTSQLEGKAWIMGDAYTIADIATFPWVNALFKLPNGASWSASADFTNVKRVLDGFLERPAVQKGLNSPPAPAPSKRAQVGDDLVAEALAEQVVDQLLGAFVRVDQGAGFLQVDEALAHRKALFRRGADLGLHAGVDHARRQAADRTPWARPAPPRARGGRARPWWRSTRSSRDRHCARPRWTCAGCALPPGWRAPPPPTAPSARPRSASWRAAPPADPGRRAGRPG